MKGATAIAVESCFCGKMENAEILFAYSRIVDYVKIEWWA